MQTGHSSSVFSVAFSPDGKTLASGSLDFTVKLWDVSTGKELRTLEGHALEVYSVAFSPNGKILASGTLVELQKLFPAASVEYVEKQPTLEEIFLAIIGKKEEH